MKFALPITLFQVCCIVAVIGLGTMRAKAPIFPPPTNSYVLPAIGTLQKVSQYTAGNVNDIGICAQAYKTNGQLVGYGCTVWAKGTNVITSKVQLDQQVIVPALSNIVLYNFCTNSNPVWDKSKGVVITVLCDIDAPTGYTSQALLWYVGTIQLVKNGDGTYSVPDLSWFSTLVNDPMPFYIPWLQWVRVEVGSNGFTYPFEVDDDLYKAGSGLLSSADTFLYLPTRYITNSSTAGGNLWMKITLNQTLSLIYPSVHTNVFLIFNGDGNRIPETPMVLALNQHGTNTTATVNGGDSGRGFVLQNSTALTAWTNCSPVTFISPTNDLPNALPSRFVYPSTNRSLFFRTATTNLPPT